MTKTNIKSRVVKRIRKGIFKIIKIFIFILKSKLLLSKVVIGLSSRENDNFSVFLPFVEDSDKLVYCTFYAHFDLLQLSQRYSFLK